jgi:hypothetical protein
MYVRFRVQDSNNYWSIRITNIGTLVLEEVVAGVISQRINVVAIVSSGHRIVVVAEGSTIRVYSNNDLRGTYASASNFSTAAAGELNSLGTGGAVSDIVAWPRTISGAAALLLDEAVA